VECGLGILFGGSALWVVLAVGVLFWLAFGMLEVVFESVHKFFKLKACTGSLEKGELARNLFA
jgi:hypothetical protein